MKMDRYGFAARLLCATALMAPLFFGKAMATPSSQIVIPSPDTVPAFFLHVDVDNTTTLLKKREEGGHSKPMNLGFTFGLFESMEFGMEAGVDIREQSDYPLVYNFKVVMKEDALAYNTPAVVFGAYELGDPEGEADLDIVYGLVAKSLPVLGRVSAGIYISSNNRLKDETGKEESAGFLASYDRTLAEIDDRLWFAVDYMSGNHAMGALSIGLSWRFATYPGPAINALLGYNIYNNDKMAGEDTFTIQFDMDFGR